MNRKEFIKLTSLTSGWIVAGGMGTFLNSCRKDNVMMRTAIKVKEGSFSKALTFPGLLNKGASLTSFATVAQLVGEKSTSVWTYNGSCLGPTIEINKGDNFSTKYINELSEESVIHWHGLLLPSDMDGHPDNTVFPGNSFDYNFPIIQRAGAYWYHPHTHMKTARQVYMGLAGFFIVRDSEELSLNLPSGANEIPLAIQDKRFFHDYSINYNPTMDDVMTGYLGDAIIVNGTFAPYHEVKAEWYRLRILNGSNARIYNLNFSNGNTFYIIGNDGGLLPAPIQATSVLLAPGERCDLLLDLSSGNIGDEIYLQNNVFNGDNFQGADSFKILKFKITQKGSNSFTLPSSLSLINPIQVLPTTFVRNFDISNASGGAHAQHGAGSGMMEHKINGKAFDMKRIDAVVNAGDTEVWHFDNSMGNEPHPMHMHGVQFQVISRTGGRSQLFPVEGGWKDTVLVMAKEQVKVAVTFPNYKGKFLMHCHNLEHEDSGMMINFEIQ